MTSHESARFDAHFFESRGMPELRRRSTPTRHIERGGDTERSNARKTSAYPADQSHDPESCTYDCGPSVFRGVPGSAQAIDSNGAAHSLDDGPPRGMPQDRVARFVLARQARGDPHRVSHGAAARVFR